MNAWRIFTTGCLVLTALGAVYLASRIGKFAFVGRLAKDRKWERFLIGLLITAAASYIIYSMWGAANLIVCIIHVLAFWLLAGLGGVIVRGVRGKESQYYIVGLVAVILSAAYLSYGWYTAHHVVRTDYELKTEKDLGGSPLRIILFSDSHIGATFHSDKFAGYVKEMEALDPDAIVIVGDFVDDYTTREDMEGCCAALGQLDIREGIYFVDGNHDGGYFGAGETGFNRADLWAELEKNNVTVLCDEAVLLQDRFYLIGREDARYRGRKSMENLLDGLDREKYMVVLDHQPRDYENQEKSGVDLVLSGHTHGGWLFPATIISRYTGSDDKVYGLEKRSNTDFIVTSGIADWALKFKTGTLAEYVVIDIAD